MGHDFSIADCSIPLSIDEDFLRRECRQRVRRGEHMLMLALLQDAINCYCACLWAKDKKGKQLFSKTEHGTLGLNPERVREEATAMEGKANRGPSRGKKASPMRQGEVCKTNGKGYAGEVA